MTVDVQPIETNDGQHWIDIVIDDRTSRHGPYRDCDAAGSMARRLLQYARTLNGGGPWVKS